MDVSSLMEFWPVAITFVTIVIVLAKMHYAIQVLEDKVKTLFDLHNSKKN